MAGIDLLRCCIIGKRVLAICCCEAVTKSKKTLDIALLDIALKLQRLSLIFFECANVWFSLKSCISTCFPVPDLSHFHAEVLQLHASCWYVRQRRVYQIFSVRWPQYARQTIVSKYSKLRECQGPLQNMDLWVKIYEWLASETENRRKFWKAKLNGATKNQTCFDNSRLQVRFRKNVRKNCEFSQVPLLLSYTESSTK